MASGREYLGHGVPEISARRGPAAEPGNAGGTRGAGSGVSASERKCKRLALAPGLVFGRPRVGIRIILCALLIRIAAAPVGVGQAAREVLIRLPSDSARTDFMLRFR